MRGKAGAGRGSCGAAEQPTGRSITSRAPRPPSSTRPVELVGWRGTDRDVTDRIQAEAERERLLAAEKDARAAAEAAQRDLAAQNERLRELDRLKDEFLALVSHELRTPLTSIRGYTELLVDGEAGELTEDQLQFLGVVERNTNRLLHLVGDLLFLAQVEAGKLTLELGPLDLGAVASESVETARPQAEAKGITLTLATGPVQPISGDYARIAQLLDNLVSNAIKFTGDGGRVDVRVHQKQERVVVEVRDSGIGIPEDEQQFLFQRFFRTSTATEQAIQGTGLGTGDLEGDRGRPRRPHHRRQRGGRRHHVPRRAPGARARPSSPSRRRWRSRPASAGSGSRSPAPSRSAPRSRRRP